MLTVEVAFVWRDWIMETAGVVVWKNNNRGYEVLLDRILIKPIYVRWGNCRVMPG